MTSGNKRPPPSKAVIESFRLLDTDCIGDVMHALGLNCIVQGLNPLSRGMKVCGPAATVRQVPLQDPATWGEHETFSPGLVGLCQPGDVLVIDVGGRVDLSPWGSNATLFAKRHGLDGVVIDGACRDSGQILEIGFPTFARGACVLHSHGLVRTVCLNSEPVQLGTPPRATSVAPGDLVIGDEDGIVVVPAGRAREILELAQQRHLYEEAGINEWRAGIEAVPVKVTQVERRERIRNLARQLGLKGDPQTVSGL